MPLLRVATRADAPAVLALWREAEAEPSHTDDLESLGRLLVRDPTSLIVAEANDKLVGSVIAAWDGWRGSIYRLAVAPSHRRRGLGRELVRVAEERLAAAGAVRMQAIVVETDPHAVAFWRASGWEEQAARLRFVKG
jgi:ribosomal protein S18 acetylase RimI-like enzyme